MIWKNKLKEIVERRGEGTFPLLVYKVDGPPETIKEIEDLIISEFYSLCNGGFIQEYNFLPLEKMLDEEEWKAFTTGFFETEEENILLQPQNYVIAMYFGNPVIWNSDENNIYTFYIDGFDTESMNKTYEAFIEDIFNKELYDESNMWRRALDLLKC